jgi:hypothetical protein
MRLIDVIVSANKGDMIGVLSLHLFAPCSQSAGECYVTSGILMIGRRKCLNFIPAHKYEYAYLQYKARQSTSPSTARHNVNRMRNIDYCNVQTVKNTSMNSIVDLHRNLSIIRPYLRVRKKMGVLKITNYAI